MATITAAMVKELRESTGAGMMDCKAALTETGGDMHGSAGLAAQEGPVEGRQEGRPRRGGRPDRRADLGRQGRRGRSQFGDRFRCPQRAVPGPRQDDRPGRAPRRRRRRDDQGGQGRRRHGRDRDFGRDRDHRREHVAAPRGFARSRPGRGVELRPWRRDRRRRQDGRAGRAGIRPARPTNSRSSAVSWPCTWPRPIRRRWIRPVSIRRS